MGERADLLTSTTDRDDLGPPSDPAAIEEEIELTRDAMSETVDTIQERLDPDRLSTQMITTASAVTDQAVSAATEVTVQARDAAKDVAKYAIDEATTAVRELANQATAAVRGSTVGRAELMIVNTRDTAEVVKSDLFTTIKQNPVPAVLAAIGIGWLWSHRASGAYSPRYSARGDLSTGWNEVASNLAAPNDGAYSVSGTQSGRVQQTADQAKKMAGQMISQVQERTGLLQEKTSEFQEQVGQIPGQIPVRAGQVQQQAQGFWQMLEDNPVAVGALGAVLGGIAGLMLPETEQERQFMGESRDRVIGSVQEIAGQTLDKVQHVAQQATTAAVDEAKAQGIMPPSGGDGGLASTDLG
jgi:hypothetical protein